MAKAKIGNPTGFSGLPPLPDPRTLPKPPKWEELLTPKPKRALDVMLINKQLLLAARAGADPNLVLAIGITNAIVARAEAGMQPKTPDPVAWSEWRMKLQAAVIVRLGQNGNWAQDAANVLQVAFDMGTIAALLCGAPGVSGQATPDQLKASFRAAKLHSTCQANTGSGGGAWCTFDWF